MRGAGEGASNSGMSDERLPELEDERRDAREGAEDAAPPRHPALGLPLSVLWWVEGEPAAGADG